MSSKKQTIQLLATGNLVPTLHYGIYAVNWWTFIDKKTLNEEKQICIPLRLNMRVQLELNKTKFIVRIVSVEDDMKPGYVCESDVASKIYLSASEALGYSGDDIIGYLSSFMYKYQGNQSLFVQNIESKYCYIEVFQKKERVAYFRDVSPTGVWKKTGILKNYNEQELNIIELMIHLKLLYPPDYEFTDREVACLEEDNEKQDAIKNLSGTSVAHLKLKLNHMPIKTISDKWTRYSQADILKLIEEPLHKLIPDVSVYTKPNSI
ncbi:6559_t:CDS:2 [Funneliformis caledonium]|uniref:6559_t:CDS:1 n=1 Tax=Funneliformis caledonium TaxID=1117310 RepID=A0A9N9GKK3_9GLOM|nr:6559_t:CDS:2 [Funneliformis caledonium]